MDLRHQSIAMCIIMLGGEDTHPWSATKVGNPIPATIPIGDANSHQIDRASNYTSFGPQFFCFFGPTKNLSDDYRTVLKDLKKNC